MNFNENNIEENTEIKWKIRKNIINRIKKEQQWNYSFHYLTKFVGKDMKGSLKRLHEVDKEGNIIETYLNREMIEKKLIQFNTKHFKQAQNTNAFNDKIYNKLKNNETWDKILKGALEQNDCICEKTFNFLFLLKQPENFIDTIIYQPINTAE